MPQTNLAERLDRLESGILQNLSALVVAGQSPKVVSRSDRMWDVATKLSVPIVLGALTFIWNLDGRVKYIEATRITAIEFQQRMSALEARMATAAEGPEWLRSELSALRTTLDSVKETMAKVSERVVRVESSLEAGKK